MALSKQLHCCMFNFGNFLASITFFPGDTESRRYPQGSDSREGREGGEWGGEFGARHLVAPSPPG